MSCILGSPLSEAGGVTITGVDLSSPLPPSRQEQIRAGLAQTELLVDELAIAPERLRDSVHARLIKVT